MATKTLPAQDVLLQLLRYEPDTGKLFWRHRGEEWFKSGVGRYTARRAAAAWNTRHADKEAFTGLTHGYHEGAIFRSNYRAHRVIWKMVTGEDPEVIDHLDRDRGNNRWENLSNTSHAQNLRNCGLSKNNTSGMTGVRWDDRQSRWHAQIMVDYKTINLGYFEAVDDAVAARQSANRKFGFSHGHGV